MTFKLTAREAFREMAVIRRFEEKVLELSTEGEIAGSVHLCLGQEAIPVGALAALSSEDRILATYRGHGWALACGTDQTALMAEIAQRAGGVNGGRAGSPMLSDPSNGFLGENSIIGAGLPIGAGVALASQLRGQDRVAVASLGDGAMNQGGTTEAMIFAAAKNLPIIFICENNDWAEMTHRSITTRGEHLAQRAQGLNIESYVVDGGDPVAVYEAVSLASASCRAGSGPVFLEMKTTRLSGHYNRDIQHYRSAEDIEAAKAADPLLRMRQSGDISDDEADAVMEEVNAEVERVVAAVRQMPPPSLEDATSHVYGDPEGSAVVGKIENPVEKEMPYFRAINEALKLALTDSSDTLLYGEDVATAGGIFGVTRGLQKEFGEERVFDTPISETAILGSAVGAAMAGLRPIVEIMWADFVFVALDQIVNQASNVRYINRSSLHAPLVIRMQQGITSGSCAQHSQSIEAILCHIPGIKVGMPSTPQDAYAMTIAAIEDDDPVVMIEHRSMYQDQGIVTLAGATENAAGAKVHGNGKDGVIITWGAMVKPSLEAAERLASEGIQCTVIDARWLNPFDDETVSDTIANSSGNVVVAHQAVTTAGFGAEIAARISEKHFDLLSGPVKRVGLPDTRVPSAPNLQDAIVPGVDDIVQAVKSGAKHTMAAAL